MNWRKSRLFLFLPLENGCWGWRVLRHQRHLGSYLNVKISLHFSPLSSPTYLLTSHFFLCGCHLAHFSFSFTHNIQEPPFAPVIFCLPTLEMETCCLGVSMWKRKLELDTTLFRRNTIRLLSPKVPKPLLLSSILETCTPALRNPWSLESAILLLNLGIWQEKLATQSRTASDPCQNAITKPPHSIFCLVVALLSRFHILSFTFTS